MVFWLDSDCPWRVLELQQAESLLTAEGMRRVSPRRWLTLSPRARPCCPGLHSMSVQWRKPAKPFSIPHPSPVPGQKVGEDATCPGLHALWSLPGNALMETGAWDSMFFIWHSVHKKPSSTQVPQARSVTWPSVSMSLHTGFTALRVISEPGEWLTNSERSKGTKDRAELKGVLSFLGASALEICTPESHSLTAFCCLPCVGWGYDVFGGNCEELSTEAKLQTLIWSLAPNLSTHVSPACWLLAGRWPPGVLARWMDRACASLGSLVSSTAAFLTWPPCFFPFPSLGQS